MMGHGDNFDVVVALTVHKAEWKGPKNISPIESVIRRPAPRRLTNTRNSCVQGVKK
jgi:hypothetical protein